MNHRENLQVINIPEVKLYRNLSQFDARHKTFNLITSQIEQNIPKKIQKQVPQIKTVLMSLDTAIVIPSSQNVSQWDQGDKTINQSISEMHLPVISQLVLDEHSVPQTDRNNKTNKKPTKISTGVRGISEYLTYLGSITNENVVIKSHEAIPERRSRQQSDIIMTKSLLINQKMSLDSIILHQNQMKSHEQNLYELRNQTKINSLKNTVRETLVHFQSLSELLINKKKIFSVLKRLLENTKYILPLITNENNDSLIDLLNEQCLMNVLRYSDPILVSGTIVHISRYKFYVEKDLRFMIQVILEYITKNRIRHLNMMKNQIVSQQQMVSELELSIAHNPSQMKLLIDSNYTPLHKQPFSFRSSVMIKSNPQLLLERVEFKVGENALITDQQRKMCREVQKVVIKLV